MSEWKEYKLGETCEIITGFSFKGDEYEPIGNLKVVRGENVTRGTLRWDNEKHWNKSTEKLEKYFLEEGDIVIGMDGSRVGQNKAIIRKEELPLILAQRVAKIKAKNGFSQEFLWYNIFSNSFKNYVESIHTGTSIPHISQGQIADFEILAPSYNEQKTIASVLSSLDNKIDLLHCQNQTLEAMAEMLFRQWFIEEAEESWEKGKLGDYMTIKHGYAFKGDFITPEETDKILVTPGNFKVGGGFSFHKFKYYTDNGFSESYILNEGDFIVTMTDLSVSNDSLGYPAFVPFIADKFLLHNQRVGKVLIKKGDESKSLFLYYLMKTSDYRHYILGSCTGTNVSHTSPSIICEYEFNVPDASKIISFKNQVQSLQVKQQSNIRQIQTLTQLRDTLLPKLMSGEVRVSEK